MTDPSLVPAVPADLLDAVAAEAPAPAAPPPPAGAPLVPPSSGGTTYTSRLLVDRWLAARGVGFRVKPEPDARGRTVYVLKECPFDPSHADPDACVMQAPDGRLSAHCFHNGCRGHGWQAFKAALGPPDPGHYDPPLAARKPGGKQRRRPAARPPAGGPAPPGAASPDATPPAGGAPPEGVPPAAEPPIEGPPTDRGTPDGRPPRRVVHIDPALPVALTMAEVTDTLVAARDCYRRAGQLVRIAGADIGPVLSAAELAGLLNHHAEVVVAAADGEEYRPLPAAYANTWLNHPGEAARLPPVTLFTLVPVYTPDWRLARPGYDPATGIYSAALPVEPRAGTAHLDRLLAEFCFRGPADRTNYVGVLVTALLGPHFVGSKPAVLFTGNQPGLGKTILAQVIAILRDGRPTETATYNPNDEEFEKRLGAIVRRGATTIVVDNAKGRGRAPRIDSACLERSITDEVLSFRLLGHSREIRAENSHQFCLTANTPDVSRDLVSRSVVVGLYHEGDPARRAFDLPDPEGYALAHRAELLGELAGLVERWRAAGSPRAEARSRFNKKGWGPVVGGILRHGGFPDFLGNAGAAAAELDDTRREFADLVAALADHPQGTWTAAELADLAARLRLFGADAGKESGRAVATRVGILAGRFVGESFPLDDGRRAEFQRVPDRKGNLYRVAVHDPEDGRGD
ncbi:hypothetical protein [Urbifossiella limnaea]|uniref:SF3 helicase domain-containing protein n=1 Tax=Urbifossiella limnaea TaxID=2528023 RepID=A0A517Y1X2_9BACT|nr:hypothetical protein [Urbifossiella limnaea]QDU23756.1 hypothetical protein ETAA1_57630 [Urbifossiella limnaea]